LHTFWATLYIALGVCVMPLDLVVYKREKTNFTTTGSTPSLSVTHLSNWYTSASRM